MKLAENQFEPDWSKGGAVILCPHEWCTFNKIDLRGRKSNYRMKTHVKKCRENFEKGKRLQHTPGMVQKFSNYVSIEKHGHAFDNFTCKTEPIDENLVDNPTNGETLETAQATINEPIHDESPKNDK